MRTLGHQGSVSFLEYLWACNHFTAGQNQTVNKAAKAPVYLVRLQRLRPADRGAVGFYR